VSSSEAPQFDLFFYRVGAAKISKEAQSSGHGNTQSTCEREAICYSSN
jgi:hypothetical protein